jgi:hypothetical protein
VPPELIDADAAERAARAFEEALRALVPPAARAGADQLLREVDRHHLLMGLSLAQDAWSTAGTWLVDHGHAAVWLALFRSCAPLEAPLGGEDPVPADAWAFLFGRRWCCDRPELVALLPAGEEGARAA